MSRTIPPSIPLLCCARATSNGPTAHSLTGGAPTLRHVEGSRSFAGSPPPRARCDGGSEHVGRARCSGVRP
jgi:hypothetical protein